MRLFTRRNVVLMLAAFPLGILAGVWYTREPTVVLTRDTLAAARSHWRAAGVASYELSYDMHGSAYRIVWRNGRVEDASVNGQPPTSGDWRAYSVEGVFDTLEQELDNVADAAGAYAGRDDVVMMRVRFHPKLGYVERYLRGGGGIGRGATIENVQLRKIE